MAIIACASVVGSPGVTTTALGLALTWDRDVLLVDADRDPSQAIQAGYLRGADLGGRGLAGLARAHRERRPLHDELTRQSVPLTSDEGVTRRFLPGFAHPGAASVFGQVWPDLAHALSGLGAAGTDVIVDAGRIGRDGLPTPLLIEADAVLVCVRSSLRSLAALRLHLPGLVDQLESLPGHAELGLVVIGESQPYSASEIAKAFGVTVAFTLPHEPGQASVLSDGAVETRRFGEGSLLRSLRAAASGTRAGVTARARLIGGAA